MSFGSSDIPYNIKTAPFHQRVGKSQAFGSVRNPIAEEIKNYECQFRTIGNHPVIPYFDDGDGTIWFMHRLSELSSSLSSVIESINAYCFGGGLTVSRREDPSFSLPDQVEETEPISVEEYMAVKEFLEQIKPTSEHLKDVILSHRNSKIFGGTFIEVVLSHVGGKPVANMHVHDAMTVRYKIPLMGEAPMVLIADEWTDRFLVNHVPRALFTYPNWSVDEDGTMRTIIHKKRRVPNRAVYGLPRWASVLYQVYNELQHGEFMTDAYDRRFTGEVFLETSTSKPEANFGTSPEADDGDPDFEDNMMAVFSNRGSERKTVLWRNKSNDDDKTEVHEFEKKYEKDFHESQLQIDFDKIIIAFDWHEALMRSTPGKLSADNHYQNVFKNKYYFVIRPTQREELEPFNLAYEIIDNHLGTGLMEEYAITAKDLYREMMISDPETEVQEDPDLSDNPNNSPNNPKENV